MVRSIAVAFVAVILGTAACSSAPQGDTQQASTDEALAQDTDHCSGTFLGATGVGFSKCGIGREQKPLCTAQEQLEKQLAADGCRLCLNYDGTRAATRIDPIDQRSEFDWWCAVCPATSAVAAALANPKFTAAPVSVRSARVCVGTDTIKPGQVGPIREWLVEWDPRCPAGGCKGPTGGS